jgi:hypothetical protein
VIRPVERLLDHRVSGGQQRFRDGEAERLGGFEVDDEIEFGRLLDRQVGWFLTPELDFGQKFNGLAIVRGAK